MKGEYKGITQRWMKGTSTKQKMHSRTLPLLDSNLSLEAAKTAQP